MSPLAKQTSAVSEYAQQTFGVSRADRYKESCNAADGACTQYWLQYSQTLTDVKKKNSVRGCSTMMLHVS